jgi:hypothetical protein
MGSTNSKSLVEQYQRLNRMVGSLVDDDNALKFGDFKNMSDNVCDNVVILIQRDLDNHKDKNEIYEIGKDVRIIPRDYVGKDTAAVCEKISSYYARILKIILMIKVVLNSKDNGDLTFSGIVAKNITVHQGMMSIAYCNLQHTDKDNVTGRFVNGVDFEKLESFNYFVKQALGDREYKVFMANLQIQLSRDTKAKMCRDPGVSDKKMSLITGRHVFVDNQAHCARRAPSMRMNVEKLNPVFAPGLCFSRQHLTVPTSDPSVKGALDAFHNNYKTTLASIEALLHKLVAEKEGVYSLRVIPYRGVVAIEKELKTHIKEMHLRTIADFQELMNAAIETKKKMVQNSSIFGAASS